MLLSNAASIFTCKTIIFIILIVNLLCTAYHRGEIRTCHMKGPLEHCCYSKEEFTLPNWHHINIAFSRVAKGMVSVFIRQIYCHRLRVTHAVHLNYHSNWSLILICKCSLSWRAWCQGWSVGNYCDVWRLPGYNTAAQNGYSLCCTQTEPGIYPADFLFLTQISRTAHMFKHWGSRL